MGTALLLLIAAELPAGGAPPGAEFPLWRFKKTGEAACARPDFDDSGWETVGQGHSFKSRGEPGWLRTTVMIPETIDGKPSLGEPVGLRLSAGDLAEIFVGGTLKGRCDNDHPGMALLTESARPLERVAVALRVFPGSGGGELEVKLHEAVLCRVDAGRARETFRIRVDASRAEGPLPRPFSGLSQGGGMCDHEPSTARKLREAGVRWFRMDNVLTNVLKAPKKEGVGAGEGPLERDWTDFDRRVDFIHSTGAEPILCLSYMPQPLDRVANHERHSVPRDFKVWEDLCFEAARRSIDRGKRVKYWEVWNETNAGWLDPGPGKDRLEAYLDLYAASARGVRRADPGAWIGGPANASGPWDRSPERGYCVEGEKFLRGLLDRCERTGLPLDFISWHEYFQPPWIFREEVLATRAYLKDYPRAAAGVKELFITEWNYAWWPDPAQDCELGAAWCADIAMRVFIPLGVDKPCFFYVKDSDESFRGSYAMLMGPANRPKASFNVMKEFGMMAPERVTCEAAEDGELTAVASRDPSTGRLTVLVVHYPQRHGVERRVEVSLEGLPEAVRRGTARRYLVDAVHSNAWNDREKAELECVETSRLDGGSSARVSLRLLPSSVTLIEVDGRQSTVDRDDGRTDHGQRTRPEPGGPSTFPFRIDLPAGDLSGAEAVFLSGQRAAVEVYLKEDRLGRAAFAPIDAFNSLRIETSPMLELRRVSCSPRGIEKEYAGPEGLSARSAWRADAERPFFRIDLEVENGSPRDASFVLEAKMVSNVGYVNKFAAHADDLARVEGGAVRFSDARSPDLRMEVEMDPPADRVEIAPGAGATPASQPATLARTLRIPPGSRAKVSLTVKGSDRPEDLASISPRDEPRSFLSLLEGAARLETPSPLLDEFAAASTAWPAANVRRLPFGPPHGLDGRKNRSWPVVTASPDYHGIFANDCVQSMWELGLLGPALYGPCRNTVETMFRYGPKESVEWWTGDGQVWMFPAPLGDTPQIALGASWHILWSGDRELAKRWWPDIRRCLAVLPANDSDGDSLEDRPNTPYPEQPDPGKFNHEMLYVQCFWRQAYLKASQVAEWLGLDEAGELRERAARIGRAIEEKFDAPYGLAVWLDKDHAGHPHIGHEQIIAAAEGDVSDAKALQVLDTATRPPVWTPDGPLRAEPGKGVAAGDHVWSFMRWKVVQAMFRLGQADRALDLAERWAGEERKLLYQAPEGFPTITGTTGKGYTWTAGRALRAIAFGLTGLDLTGRGVAFAPRLPSRFPEFSLRGLTVHGTRIDLRVRRGAPGVTVDGAPRERALIEYRELAGRPVAIEVSVP